MNKGEESKNINKETQMQRNFQKETSDITTPRFPHQTTGGRGWDGCSQPPINGIAEAQSYINLNFEVIKKKIVNSKLLPASRKCNPSLHSDHIEQLLKFLLTCDDIYKSAEAHAYKRIFTPKTFYDH